MTSSTIESQLPTATKLEFNDDQLTVDLSDGRTISVPVAWYPRLSHGTTEERNNFRWIGGGRGIHWPELGEDVSVENLLLGRASGESQGSLKRWLEQRASKETSL